MTQSAHSELPLVPYPREIQRTPGIASFSPESSFVADECFRETAEFFARVLRRSTGWKWDFLPSPKAPAMVFRKDDTLREAESYALSATPERILIAAADPAGAFYGGQTLLQLLPPAVFSEAPIPDVAWTAPCVEIKDAPRFRWRGVMLDSVRHFQPISYIRKFIDLLSQHKINVFHWHLTDDQGWRIEIRKYPRLTEFGSYRRETMVGHYKNATSHDGQPVGGFYTQAEIRDLVAYATERHVHILPEIEMPGHAQAAVAAYPEFGCPGRASEVSTSWGIHENLFNVQPATLAFLREVLQEVIELFPFDYVHIGGDEAVKTQWQGDPATQARLRELGLPDEDRLQSWFIGQMGDFLQQQGRKLIGWDEILEGGLPAGAAVMSWRNSHGALAAARLGHEAVMCSQEAYYFDFRQDDDPGLEPLSIGGPTTLRKTYEFEPLPGDLAPELHPFIKGIQGQLWTEYIPTSSRLEYMAFPRVCALAERAWLPGPADFPSFQRRLAGHLKRLDCQDVRHRA